MGGLDAYPISLEVDHKLLGASINTGFEKKDWEIAAEAIDERVQRHDPDALSTPAYAAYQWKRLFRVRSTDRRCDGDDRVAALLRQELLPLLYRMCGALQYHRPVSERSGCMLHRPSDMHGFVPRREQARWRG